jgi:hypothetical protein
MFLKRTENGWSWARCASPLSSLPLHLALSRIKLSDEDSIALRAGRSRFLIPVGLIQCHCKAFTIHLTETSKKKHRIDNCSSVTPASHWIDVILSRIEVAQHSHWLRVGRPEIWHRFTVWKHICAFSTTVHPVSNPFCTYDLFPRSKSAES